MPKCTDNKRRREKRRKKHDQNLHKNKLLRLTVLSLNQSLEKLRDDNDTLAGKARFYQMIKLAVKVAEERIRVLAEYEAPNMLLAEPKKFDYLKRETPEEYVARKIAYCPTGVTSYIQILQAVQPQVSNLYLECMVRDLGDAIARDIFTHLINNTRIV